MLKWSTTALNSIKSFEKATLLISIVTLYSIHISLDWRKFALCLQSNAVPPVKKCTRQTQPSAIWIAMFYALNAKPSTPKLVRVEWNMICRLFVRNKPLPMIWFDLIWLKRTFCTRLLFQPSFIHIEKQTRAHTLLIPIINLSFCLI